MTPPSNQQTPTTDGAAAADPLLDRVDAMIADAQRKEADFTEAQRVEAQRATEAAKVIPVIIMPGEPQRMAPAAETKTEPAAKGTSEKVTTAESVKDEAYWRGRMTTLRGNMARDYAGCAPLVARVRELDGLYDRSVFYVDGKAMVNRASAAVIETKQADAKIDQQQCLAKVALDQTAIDTVLEEARRLGVLPGWLR